MSPIMRFEILSLFPEAFNSFLKTSLIGKAIQSGLISIHAHNIRDFAQGPHAQADDRPYGGGPGMVLMAEPIYQSLTFVKKNCLAKLQKKPLGLILSPRGTRLGPESARRLAGQRALVLLAGHYEGVDERVRPYFDGELSIGDFVTMGGEVPAMAVIEAVARFVPGVIKEAESLVEESFSIHEGKNQLLEWPQYTRPLLWRGRKTPRILLSGHHAQIKAWRRAKALSLTHQRRKDLLK
ncbi:MAG: tRNA (guanosine(37)-N1)-methyltransferase TrmD [Elusimicrobia bacterium]|nr:tRNA (guanosine(37)-N1)-methyltransferase TrmD [Elusimicrobiota bacterium]